MSAVTWNVKYNLYQVKGTKNIYLFDFDYCQQVKTDFESYRDPSPEIVDQWYNDLGSFRRKKIKAVQK